jgi:hypothetical protein
MLLKQSVSPFLTVTSENWLTRSDSVPIKDWDVVVDSPRQASSDWESNTRYAYIKKSFDELNLGRMPSK